MRRRRVSATVPVQVAERVERAVQRDSGMTLAVFIAQQLAAMDEELRRPKEHDDEEEGSDRPGYL